MRPEYAFPDFFSDEQLLSFERDGLDDDDVFDLYKEELTERFGDMGYITDIPDSDSESFIILNFDSTE